MMGNAMYRKQVTTKEYQSWTGYPDSPYLYSVFPYQTILDTYGLINLIVSVRPFYRDGSLVVDGNVFEGVYYDDITHAWGTATDHYSARNTNSIIESNHNIYTDATLMSVDFAKTTTTEQDGGTTTSLIRIRNLHHKDGASLIRDKAAFWLEKSVNSSYQQWTGYPANLLVSLSTYPYQYLAISSTNQWSESLPVLVAGIAPFITNQGVRYIIGYEYPETESHLWAYRNGAWVSSGTTGNVLVSQSTVQTNHDIVRDTDRTLMYAKTTTPAQDAGISETLHRINI